MKRILIIFGLILLFFIATSFVTEAAPPVEGDAVSYAEIDQSQNFYTYLNRKYWIGSRSSTDLYQTNYFARYINEIILPASSSSAEFTANVSAFVNQVKTIGIVVDLPSNLSIKLFVNAWYQASIDPWYEIAEPVSQVVIKMTDLVVEGVNYPDQVDEAWGKTLIYVVDGTPYEFHQVHEDYSDIIVPPLIGIEILSDETYTVSFVTRSDDVIPDQLVASGSTAETPAEPTRIGHSFYGWTTESWTPEIVPWIGSYHLPTSTDWPHNTEITGDTVFYALWTRDSLNVNLVLNGGTKKKGIPYFSSGLNILYVQYQGTVYTNMYEVDFDDMVERSGFELVGWYTNSSLTSPFNTDTIITSDITIYAKWSKVYAGVEDLPETEGNPYDVGLTGTATFTYLNNNFDSQISYDGEIYNIKFDGIVFSSASFLSNVSSVDYYSIDGDAYLQFNYNGSPNALLSTSSQLENNWSLFGIWNLTDNEITLTQRALVLTYLNMDKQTRDAYAYLYMPTVVMDDLISTSLVFNYRYLYPLGIKGKWQNASLFLERGVESISERVPQDILDIWTYSTAAMAVGAFIPVLRWPILAAGGIAINVANGMLLNHILTGSITEIEPVSADTVFRLRLNEYYSIAAGRPVNVGSSEQVYRLYLGKYSEIGSTDAEIDNSTYKYTEIVYVSDGEVITLTAPYIDQHSIIDKDWVERVEEHGELNLPSWVKSLVNIAVTIIFIYGLVFKSNLFKNWRIIIPISLIYAIAMILINVML